MTERRFPCMECNGNDPYCVQCSGTGEIIREARKYVRRKTALDGLLSGSVTIADIDAKLAALAREDLALLALREIAKEK